MSEALGCLILALLFLLGIGGVATAFIMQIVIQTQMFGGISILTLHVWSWWDLCYLSAVLLIPVFAAVKD